MSCSRAEHTTEYLKPTQLFRETMKRTYYTPSAAFTLDCVPVSPHICHRSTKCRTFFTQILNRAEHQIEYLKPSQLFQETLKRDYENPVFLGFSFSKDYAIVTISKYPISRTSVYREFERDTTFLDKLIEVVRKVKDDPVNNYGLLGIVVEDNNSVKDIHNLMDNLCKKGNFESLKYTCWKHDIESENSAWDRSAAGSLFCRETFYYKYARMEVISAENMLLSFVDFFYALYVDVDLEREEDKDLEREDKDLEREDSKRKIEYLKPSQLFRETVKRDYQNPVFLGFSFSIEYAIVTISNYPISRARIYREFPIETTFLENLIDVVRSVKNDAVEKYDLVGIIIDNNNSVKDIHNLMDNLCKKGNFKSLKYTCWKDNIGSKNSIYDSLFFSAELMLQRFQDVFRALCIDKDEEDKD